MSTSNDVQALRYLPSVRERCSAVYKLAQEGKVDSFTLDETRYDAVVDLCAKAINVRSRLRLSHCISLIEQKDYGENYASVSHGLKSGLGIVKIRSNHIPAGGILRPQTTPTSSARS
jgi:hypothetical protein